MDNATEKGMTPNQKGVNFLQGEIVTHCGLGNAEALLAAIELVAIIRESEKASRWDDECKSEKLSSHNPR